MDDSVPKPASVGLSNDAYAFLNIKDSVCAWAAYRWNDCLCPGGARLPFRLVGRNVRGERCRIEAAMPASMAETQGSVFRRGPVPNSHIRNYIPD
jgi:hypothetical protein